MRCPKCGAPETRVIETRNAEEGKVVRRRRECSLCDARFTTYERLEEGRTLCIVKKDGCRESFDREKLLHGLVRACEKLSVPLESLEGAVNSIEDRLRNSGQGEFASTLVGEYAMDELRKIHKVAYVRFASVYREFTDVSNFDEEIRRLASESQEPQ